jgi:four helix bundle protein
MEKGELIMEAMREPQIRDFRRLGVYQKSIELDVEVKSIVRTFPHEEKDALGKQLWRAVTSISGNISEGNSQLYINKELSFFAISLGSAGEVQTWLEIAFRIGYIQSSQISTFG